MRLSTVVLSLAIPFAGLAAPSSSQPRNGPESLAALYELGGAVADENGDGVADRLRARLVLADAPSAGEVAAAAEIAARLGLETMALDLPLPDAAPLAITVGDEALRAAGCRGLRSWLPDGARWNCTPSAGQPWWASGAGARRASPPPPAGSPPGRRGCS